MELPPGEGLERDKGAGTRETSQAKKPSVG